MYKVRGLVVQREISDDDLYETERPTPLEGGFSYPGTYIVPNSMWIVRKSRIKTFTDSRDYYLVPDGWSSPVYWEIYPGDPELEAGFRSLWRFSEGGLYIRSPFPHYTPNPSLDIWGLEVPPEIAWNHGLTEGDEVLLTVNPEAGYIRIHTVNGYKDPKKQRSWPKDLGDILKYQPLSPVNQFPLGQYSHGLRLMELLAPVGPGNRILVPGMGSVGKSTLTLDFVRACMQMSKEGPFKNRLHLVYATIGEHMEEGGRFKWAIEEYGGNAEFHQSPRGLKKVDNPANAHVRLAEFLFKRVYRLVAIGYVEGGQFENVVLVIDGAGRVFDALSAADPAEASRTFARIAKQDTGKVGKGADRAAVNYTTQMLFPVGGNFDRSTLTTYLTTLDDPKASEGIMYAEAGKSMPTVIWALRKFEEIKGYYPQADLVNTLTRTPPETADVFPLPKHQREMKHLEMVMSQPQEYFDENGKKRKGTPSESTRYKRAWEYAKDEPVPAYMK